METCKTVLTSLSAAVAVFMVAGLAYGASPTAHGSASVVIAAASGVSSTSNLEVAFSSSSGGSEKSSNQPAQFSISGVPYQAFSVSLPESVLTETPEGKVVLTRFFHNAGAVPVIGPTGKGAFSVVGQAERPRDPGSFVEGSSGHRFSVIVTYN